MRRSFAGCEVLVVVCFAVGCGDNSDSPSMMSSAGAGGDVGGAGASNGGGLPGAGGVQSSDGGAGRPLDAAVDAGADSGNGKTTNDAGMGDAPQTAAPFDWVGVVGTGQSLAEGWESTAISTNQSFKNLKLVDQGADPQYPLQDSATAK